MSQEDKRHRSHLPMPNTERPTFIAYDAKDPDSKFPPIPQLRPPKGAPNVLVILIDDMGFGVPSAFGGPVRMPRRIGSPAGGCVTTSSTPRRSARRRARPCSPDAIITPAAWATSRRPPPARRATAQFCPTASDD